MLDIYFLDVLTLAGSLIDLCGALLCPAVAIIPLILMWFHDNWEWNGFRPGSLSPRKAIMAVINIIFLIVGVFFTIGGTYAAILELINTKANGGPWSCLNNSGRIR